MATDIAFALGALAVPGSRIPEALKVFLVALFISALAFAGTPFEREAQLAILIASLLAAGVGLAVLLTTEPAPEPQSK